MTLAGREGGCDLPNPAFEFAEGGAEGVLERGGGLATTGVSSSRYLSPWTRNGLPYSSSHLSNSFRRSASTLGNSLAILFLIFSSLKSLPGSRLSPLLPRAMRREAS
jgi:hypothetical protein